MKCPQCNTENGYARLETKDWVCRKCSKISPIIFKEKVDHPKEEEPEIDETKEALTEQRKKYLEE